MTLEDQIRLHKELSKKIEEMEEQKRQLAAIRLVIFFMGSYGNFRFMVGQKTE
jgi:hypothetical protein